MTLRKKRVWTETDIRLNEQFTNLTEQIHGLSCPACGSRNYAKSGKEKGNQRYTCCKCRKHFRSTTGCTIHHLHLKPKIQQYIDCMNQGLSLRKTAAKCDISLQTAFRWRHRFLKAMHKQPVPNLHENRVVSALVMPFSNKGKAALPAVSSNITSILQIDAAGRSTIDILGKYGLGESKLTGTASRHSAHIASKALPKRFKPEPAKCLTNQQYLQIQEYTSQIQRWLAKFRGVASRYLVNYWRWFMHITQTQLRIKQETLYMHYCF